MVPATQKVWFITGASSGFGRALTEAALTQGNRVIATARDPHALGDIADRAPEDLRVLPLDVTDPAACRSTASQAMQEWGHVDVVVNNAGRGLFGAVEETNDTEARANLDVNFFGPVNLIQGFLPHFRQRRSGHFIQMGAAAAIANYPGFGFYGAAKAALSSLTESLHQELKPLGIRVTLVEPGPFRTAFIARAGRVQSQIPDYANTAGRFLQYLARIDGRQPGDPHRAAQAILQVVQSPDAPLRLVLGRYAIDKTRKTFAARERDLVVSEPIGGPTDTP